MIVTPRLLLIGAAVSALSLPSLASACATCGCTLSTDAANGYSTEAGWRLNVEYAYIDQDQLRGGTHVATPAQVVNSPSDPSLAGGEIEKDTTNRYISAILSYRPNVDWNFSLLIPYVLRDHSTYGFQSQPFTPAEVGADQISTAKVSDLGDMKLVASYQGILQTHNFGVQLGIKLPTGNYGGQRADGTLVGSPVLFRPGGVFGGQALDTSLQAGTGSTDVIVGAYYYQPVSQNFDAFVNGQFQAAVVHKLDTNGADYRPGNATTVSFGVRYEAHANWVPQIQMNLLHKTADQGALADRPDTAGSVAYVSPGLTVTVRKNFQVYGFAQLPVYSHLAGYQLFPRWTATIGASVAF